MTTVSIPQKGQPFDLAYISELANAINVLSDKIAVNNMVINNIWSGGATSANNLSASEIKIVTNQVNVSGLKAAVGSTVTTRINFDGFQGNPLLLISVIADIPIQCWIKSITATTADVVLLVTSKDGKVENVKLNYMAIGKPA